MSLAMLWESVLKLDDVEQELEDVQEGGLGNNPGTGTDVKKLITLTNIYHHFYLIWAECSDQ